MKSTGWQTLALATVTGIGLLLGASNAIANGVVLRATQLSATDRSQLVASIGATRKAHPESHKAVRSTASKAAELNARKRGRLAPMGQRFRTLGAEALLPMLELVAIDAPADRDCAKWRFGRALRGARPTRPSIRAQSHPLSLSPRSPQRPNTLRPHVRGRAPRSLVCLKRPDGSA